MRKAFLVLLADQMSVTGGGCAVSDAEDEHPDEAEMMATIKEKPILQMTDEEQNGVQKKTQAEQVATRRETEKVRG